MTNIDKQTTVQVLNSASGNVLTITFKPIDYIVESDDTLHDIVANILDTELGIRIADCQWMELQPNHVHRIVDFTDA